MKLTTRGRYAVTAMVDLMIQQDKGPVSLMMVADNQFISLSYLEQLFTKLRKAGLVKGQRGPGGGYRLARDPEDISMMDIIDAVDERVDLTRCGGARNCRMGKTCLTHSLWDKLSGKLNDFLSEISLAELRSWPSVQEAVEDENKKSSQKVRFGSR